MNSASKLGLGEINPTNPCSSQILEGLGTARWSTIPGDTSVLGAPVGGCHPWVACPVLPNEAEESGDDVIDTKRVLYDGIWSLDGQGLGYVWWTSSDDHES
jgi:hypothetical protein